MAPRARGENIAQPNAPAVQTRARQGLGKTQPTTRGRNTSNKENVINIDVCSSSSSEEEETEEQPHARRSTRRQPTAASGRSSRGKPQPLGKHDISTDSSSSDSDSDDDHVQTIAAPRGRGRPPGRGRGARTFVVSNRSRAAAAAAGTTAPAAAVAAAAAAAAVDDGTDSSSSEDEEQGQTNSRQTNVEDSNQEAAGGMCKDVKTKGKSSHKRSVLELIAGNLEEESLKRATRERADSKNLGLKSALAKSLQAQGHKWRFQLRCNYSLLLYGFGSKRSLLEGFARSVLTDGAVVAVNGFNPGVTAKQVALAAASVIVPWSVRGSSTVDILEQIRKQPVDPERHVYVILHNIDGPGLRAPGEQALLAELAACPGVHLAASIDHINAPLLWDVKTRARFRWLYHDATTFAPYLAETLDMPPALLACFHETTRRGASTALGSMAPNAQAVFKVLAEAQLDDPSSPGLTFPTLFRMCRERWLVTNEQALRGFLAEFHDHELVSERMAALEGGEQREVLYVPLEEEVLRKLLEEAQQQQEGQA